MRKRSTPNSVETVKILCGQPGAASTTLRSKAGQATYHAPPNFSTALCCSSQGLQAHPSVCSWMTLQPLGHSLAPSFPTTAKTNTGEFGDSSTVLATTSQMASLIHFSLPTAPGAGLPGTRQEEGLRPC